MHGVREPCGFWILRMIREYICPNCHHSGRLLGEDAHATVIDPTCPHCGARIDTIAVAGLDEITSPGEEPHPTAYPPAFQTDYSETVNCHKQAGSPAFLGYDVLGERGRGGRGVVYHPREAKLNRSVALKGILSE